MQYSCAYFEQPDMTLDEAQAAKKRHIAAKLRLKPGQTVLDIGSGWGGLGLYLAKSFDVDVQGVTLSTEQHGVATDRAHAQGLENRVHFELKDYRELNERFDRIVSVGMFEHVGVNHYRTFFDKCATLLKPDGVMLLHTIGRSGVPWATSAFIRKYIFPGGYIPALSEVMPAIEKSGLVVTDIEILRLHYADTLKHWGQRFAANRDKAKAIYDERFCRMWEFYLAASEAAFRWQDLVDLPDPDRQEERHAADDARLHGKMRKSARNARHGSPSTRDCEARSPPQGGGSGITSSGAQSAIGLAIVCPSMKKVSQSARPFS